MDTLIGIMISQEDFDNLSVVPEHVYPDPNLSSGCAYKVYKTPENNEFPKWVEIKDLSFIPIDTITNNTFPYYG